MDGLHLTADLHGCPLAHATMTDIDALRTRCLRRHALRRGALMAVLA